MIHSTVLLRSGSGRTIATSRYWTTKVPKKEITEYLKSLVDLREVSGGREDISLLVGGNKYFSRKCTDEILLVFIADIDQHDRLTNEKMDSAAEAIREVLDLHSIKYIKANYEAIIAPFVHSKLKIALVGEGGVGKTTTLHLLMGEQPPLQYIPTIALSMEVIENIQFANYSLVLWDFAGQERFRRLWKFSRMFYR